LFARRAIGYSISRTIDTALCLGTLTMAIAHRKPPKGVVHHSGRGVQYASSHDYVAVLLHYGFLMSMSRKGNPYDNATTESFFKTIKVEEICLWEYRTLADVQIRLPFFIQEVYNNKRLPSSSGIQTATEI